MPLLVPWLVPLLVPRSGAPASARICPLVPLPPARFSSGSLLACVLARPPVARTTSDCLGKVQPVMRAATQELKDQLSLDSEKDNPGPFSRHDIVAESEEGEEEGRLPSAPASTTSFINPTVIDSQRKSWLKRSLLKRPSVAQFGCGQKSWIGVWVNVAMFGHRGY